MVVGVKIGEAKKTAKNMKVLDMYILEVKL